MNISVSQQQGNVPVTVIKVDGQLDGQSYQDLISKARELYDAGARDLILGLSDLTYLSSAGLGVFMAYIEDVRMNKGDIKLTNMSPKVYNVFDLLGFPILYEIYKDEAEAVNRFKQAKKVCFKARFSF